MARLTPLTEFSLSMLILVMSICLGTENQFPVHAMEGTIDKQTDYV